jgi:hypothetical protein
MVFTPQKSHGFSSKAPASRQVFWARTNGSHCESPTGSLHRYRAPPRNTKTPNFWHLLIVDVVTVSYLKNVCIYIYYIHCLWYMYIYISHSYIYICMYIYIYKYGCMIIFHSLEISSVSYRDDFPQTMIPMRSRREVTIILPRCTLDFWWRYLQLKSVEWVYK